MHYGFAQGDLPSACASQVPEFLGGGNGYTGIVESHPYGVTATPGGWVIADAAGNSLSNAGNAIENTAEDVANGQDNVAGQ